MSEGTDPATSNVEQSRYWNEQGGPKWVALEDALDAQLEPFGKAVLGKLALQGDERVIDVGCGAGATSILLSESVPRGRVTGVDVSGPLVARARVRGASRSNLAFTLADAQTFAFEAASADVLFSRFGVMFFDDPVAAFANLRTALRPGGRLAFVCWRPMSENPSFTLPLEAGRPFLVEPPVPPAPGAPGPFAFAETGRVATLLASAGFASIDVTPFDTDIAVAGRSDLEAAVDLALNVGPLARALPEVDPTTREKLRDAVRAAFLPHHGPRGVILPAATWIATATRAA
ncbi:MAG: class I SAM-dependent methyltransferase [Polyangiaceae bacterium]